MGGMKKKDETVNETTIAETGPVTLTGEPQTVTLAEVGELPAEAKKKPVKSPRVDALRKELEQERDKLAAELKGYREYHDKHVNDSKFLESRKKIKEISAKLGPVQNELARLAASEGGITMKASPGVIGTKVGS